MFDEVMSGRAYANQVRFIFQNIEIKPFTD